MDWLLATGEIYSTFAALGETIEDRGYVVSEDCHGKQRHIDALVYVPILPVISI